MNKKISDYARRVIGSLQDYFFPKSCFNCHKEGMWICESCKNSLFFVDARYCPFCHELTDLFDVCERCQQKTNIKKAFSLFKYGDPLVQKLIKNLKYRYLEDIIFDLEPLIKKFFFKYKSLISIDSAVLIPVPLRKYKRCERGFNQAESIAGVLGAILNLKIDNKLIQKCRLTKNQAEVDLKERHLNIKGAFELCHNPPKKIIIVDDVLTSGSTVKEIAYILSAGGVENIQVITLARG